MAYKRGTKIAAYGSSFIPATVMFHFTLFLVQLVDWLLFRLTIEGKEQLQGLSSAL